MEIFKKEKGEAVVFKVAAHGENLVVHVGQDSGILGEYDRGYVAYSTLDRGQILEVDVLSTRVVSNHTAIVTIDPLQGSLALGIQGELYHINRAIKLDVSHLGRVKGKRVATLMIGATGDAMEKAMNWEEDVKADNLGENDDPVGVPPVPVPEQVPVDQVTPHILAPHRPEYWLYRLANVDNALWKHLDGPLATEEKKAKTDEILDRAHISIQALELIAALGSNVCQHNRDYSRTAKELELLADARPKTNHMPERAAA